MAISSLPLVAYIGLKEHDRSTSLGCSFAAVGALGTAAVQPELQHSSDLSHAGVLAAWGTPHAEPASAGPACQWESLRSMAENGAGGV